MTNMEVFRIIPAYFPPQSALTYILMVIAILALFAMLGLRNRK